MLQREYTLMKEAAKDIIKHLTVVLLCDSTLLCLFFRNAYICICPKSVYQFDNFCFVSYCLKYNGRCMLLF